MISRVHIIGCGTFGNGDDQVGLDIAKRIRDLRPDWRVSLETAGGANALEWADQADALFIIDACHAGNGLDLGQMLRIDFVRHPDALEQWPFSSTHSVSVVTGLKLLVSLRQLPPHVDVYAVGTRTLDPFKPLSPHVQAAIPKLAQHIIQDVQLLLESTPCTNSA